MNKFEDKTHEYSMSGCHVPSVTQVLPPVAFYCTDEQLDLARDEGEQLHAKLEMYLDTGSTFLDEDLLEINEVFRANERYLGDHVAHEVSLYSEKHRFAGRPDVIFEKAIVDLKRTLVDERYTALQFAGYNILAKENKVISPTKKWYVLVKKSGKFKLINVYNDLATEMFLGCVKKFHIEQAINNYLKL